MRWKQILIIIRVIMSLRWLANLTWLLRRVVATKLGPTSLDKIWQLCVFMVLWGPRRNLLPWRSTTPAQRGRSELRAVCAWLYEWGTAECDERQIIGERAAEPRKRAIGWGWGVITCIHYNLSPFDVFVGSGGKTIPAVVLVSPQKVFWLGPWVEWQSEQHSKG